MTKLDIYTEKNTIPDDQKNEVARFLFRHLEQYGDPEHDILDAINYSMGEQDKPGGLLITARNPAGETIGAVVVNKTGMSGYIPEYILVYIATDKAMRGQGTGRLLMQKAIDSADGDIALHCEPENPARHLYEKLGFSSKYIEMRLKK